MSWIARLYETYENCKAIMPPVSHSQKQAHIELSITIDGEFVGAKIVEKEETLIPVTENSAGRTSAPTAHPLCDKVQYCAADYPDYTSSKSVYFELYEELLSAWCDSSCSHPKAKAVLQYVRRRCLVHDLVQEKILHIGEDGKLVRQWQESGAAPKIFQLLQVEEDKSTKEKFKDQGNAFIRWQVHEANNPCTNVWEDLSLFESWKNYSANIDAEKGLCMVTGMESPLTSNHPKRVRGPKDGAKLISANDKSGYTFRGRFSDDKGMQACSIGYDVSQKAHIALRTLIEKQGFRNGDQAIVSWAIKGEEIPDPLANSFELLGLESDAVTSDADQSETGQAYGRRLSRKIAGYRATLGNAANIVAMGLDSATPGRMAITYYQELTGSEFLDRIESWHTTFAWHQRFEKAKRFVGAPAPKEIVFAAYGTRADDKIGKSTIERLLPCILESRPFPRDLVESTTRHVANRTAFKRDKDGYQPEWEKYLGIACALFRGHSIREGREDYHMALEPDRTTRDYLYGRLLAVAEHIEARALYLAGENRETTAARLMQRFAQRPATTWPDIEVALGPYKSRLRVQRGSFLHTMNKAIDQIVSAFRGDEFLDDSKLSGEFLLGYHCQRLVLNTKTTADFGDEDNSEALPA
ncbi:MAG: type I-C CRISPR-associated protein Cas8c/Csd1 [Magnetococcales bacterium]|nr:type I-C CRISPR-associated protein Cas8c/Csd1 [Magnetococcales bacterium]